MALFHKISDITWQDLVKVVATPNANDLEKTSAGSAWDAGARSVEEIAAASTGPFARMTFQPGQTNKHIACGMSSSNPDQDKDTIDFGFWLYSDNTFEVIESGVTKYGPTGSYLTTDVFTVEVNTSGKFEYYQNTTLLYTSVATPSYPLFVDASIFQFEASILDVKLNQEILEIDRLEKYPSSRPIQLFQSRQMTPGGTAIIGDLAPSVQYIEIIMRGLSAADKVSLLDFIQNTAVGASNVFDFTDGQGVRYRDCRFWFDDVDFRQTHPDLYSESIRIAVGI